MDGGWFPEVPHGQGTIQEASKQQEGPGRAETAAPGLTGTHQDPETQQIVYSYLTGVAFNNYFTLIL